MQGLPGQRVEYLQSKAKRKKTVTPPISKYVERASPARGNTPRLRELERVSRGESDDSVYQWIDW